MAEKGNKFQKPDILFQPGKPGDASFDEILLEQKIDLYEKLGWDGRGAERIRLLSQMRKHRMKLPQ